MNRKEMLWTKIPIYCPKCGVINNSYQDNERRLRYECKGCKATIVRSRKNRRSEILELRFPKEKPKPPYFA